MLRCGPSSRLLVNAGIGPDARAVLGLVRASFAGSAAVVDAGVADAADHENCVVAGFLEAGAGLYPSMSVASWEASMARLMADSKLEGGGDGKAFVPPPFALEAAVWAPLPGAADPGCPLGGLTDDGLAVSWGASREERALAKAIEREQRKGLHGGAGNECVRRVKGGRKPLHGRDEPGVGVPVAAHPRPAPPRAMAMVEKDDPAWDLFG